MLDRQTGLARVQPKPTACQPTLSKARIKSETPIDHPNGGTNVLTEISECLGGVGQGTRVARRRTDSLLCKINGFAAVRLLVFGPAVEIDLDMAECRNRKSTPISWIALDRPLEQIKCGQRAFFFPSGDMRQGT